MPRTTAAKTPLLVILRGLKPEQREQFAMLADTSVQYLYQLAGCKRCAGSGLANDIAKASVEIARLYGTKPITMETLAGMCPSRRGARG